VGGQGTTGLGLGIDNDDMGNRDRIERVRSGRGVEGYIEWKANRGEYEIY